MRLVEAGRHADVEAAARRILGARPTQPLALKALGFALIGQGRYDDACRSSVIRSSAIRMTRKR
jgi:hypothetical protein